MTANSETTMKVECDWKEPHGPLDADDDLTLDACPRKETFVATRFVEGGEMVFSDSCHRQAHDRGWRYKMKHPDRDGGIDPWFCPQHAHALEMSGVVDMIPGGLS